MRYDIYIYVIRRLKVNQILVGIRSRPMAVLFQFSDKSLISVVGSKIENKFLITFN